MSGRNQFQMVESERRQYNQMRYGRISARKGGLYRVKFGAEQEAETHWMPHLEFNLVAICPDLKRCRVEQQPYSEGDEVAFLLQAGGDATGLVLGRVRR